MSWVGRSLPRTEDPSLLRGLGRYVADFAQGALSVTFIRSPVAAGAVSAIEVPEGLGADHAVFTGRDLADVLPICPVLNRPDYVAVGQPVLPVDRVLFTGQAVAVAVAPSPAEAEDLADQVFIDIEPTEPVIDVDAALAPGAPVVHPEAPANVLVEGRLKTPGFDAAMAAAAHVVELNLRSRRQSAMPLETRGGVADYDPASGRVTLHASVQMPHMLRTGIADALGMRECDLRVVAPDVGGGFGQKMSLFPEYIVLVWLARRLRRKVAWIEDRRENLMAAAHSRDQAFTVRGAFTDEGRLIALEADLRSNVGAYSCYPVTCGVEPLMAFGELPGPYDFAEYSARSRGVTTNTCMMAPFRGVARPMLTFTMERLMEVAAKRIGLDPVEIRRRNLITRFPHRSPTGVVYDEASYLEAMEAAVAHVDLPAFRARQAQARAQGRHLGLGVAVFSERTGYGTPVFAGRAMGIVPGFESADMAMDPSGYVEVRIGASPHGQGLKTSLAQLVADTLGLSPDRVRVIAGDTDATPYGWGTFASRSIVIAGGAVKLAGEDLATQLRSVAATLLACEAGDVVLADNHARAAGTNTVLPMSEIARAAYHQSPRFGLKGGLKGTGFYDPSGTFSNACHIAEVEVDIATGGVKILRFVVVEDAGVLVNPMIVDGQIAGGVAQGIGNALFEEVIYDEDGNILTASLADYLPPTALEIPDIEIVHMVTLSPQTVTGAKGVGEGGTIGAPAAVLNAVADALSPFDIAINEMPQTPQRLRALIRAAQSREAAPAPALSGAVHA
ncbi:xanthine dehydrogenase family protein molybdopterin-binding subunit [Ancylobacter sp. SL191]|uniref:xanthine dehydrogenase family protein molybdopterin-binding subunit n=1 Tax=Ancylobacter sp. SL191 TaxID=2995166 RepID=UPI00226F4434|nr:xanthine dehydrogenase family protein molybdopterin-binding subunit [Ancylobacter sp. SL191]WAC25610.1 xanthine dehydrogenase family protein molybdopterin-binding subunit [Ancylobacter sp. SL191]